MTIVSVCGIAVIGLVASVILREVRPAFATAVGIITGLILLGAALSAFSDIVLFTKDITKKEGFSLYITVILKAFGIGILAETTAEVCRDNGASAIGSKVEFAAKTIILLLAMPLVKEILSRTEAFLK